MNPPSESLFKVPEKKINDASLFQKWLSSKARAVYTGFILDLNESVKGKKLSEVAPGNSSEVAISSLPNLIQLRQ